MKTCCTCKRELPETEEFFYLRTRRDKQGRRGFHAQCRTCNTKYMSDRIKNETPEARATRLRKSRDNDLRRTFGITLADYERMVSEQRGLCASCGKPPTGKGAAAVLNVDHDHATGDVRGLLCNPCNQALGLLRDDPNEIYNLLIYARCHEKPRLRLVA